jgi:hypothetical protein
MKVPGWKELYPSIGLPPDHGFEFVQLKYVSNLNDYLALLRAIGVDESDILKEQREFVDSSPATLWMKEITKTSADKVYPLLRYYLSENATNTFAIAQKNEFMGDSSGAYFYIGFRNPKDVFIFLLKFPNASRIKMVRRELGFYVRVASNDDISFSGVEHFDERNKVRWNREDPQGFL